MIAIRRLVFLIGIAGAVVGLRELLRRSNTQVHRINQ